MNILLINPFSQVAAVRQKNLAKRLAAQGHKVWLMLPKMDQYSGYEQESLPEKWDVKAIHPRQLQSKRLEISFLFYIPSALAKVLRKKVDVVHAFRPTPFSGLIGYLIAKVKRVPFILEHGDIEWETMRDLNTHPGYRVRVVRFLERFLTKRADAITVMNTKVKEYVQHSYHPKGPICLVTNGVDTNVFSPDRKSRRKEILQHLNKRKIIAFHGKLDNIEHIKDLVRVMGKLPPTYGLMIIGFGKKEGELKALAQKENVLERVWFAGRMDHQVLPEFLNGSDILIAPFARTKGVEHASNLKVFEYLAMGKPLICSKVGDLPSILKEGAVLYEPGDLKGLANAIQDCRLGANIPARKIGLAHDWSEKAKALEAIYERERR